MTGDAGSGTLAPAKAIPFSMRRTPLLSEGNTHTLLAQAPNLWAHLKVYAAGGENGVHAHTGEDHMFLVMAGEATFIDEHDNETVVGPNQGMMVPRGASYAFRSSTDENLVMVRIGSAVEAGPEFPEEPGMPTRVRHRIKADGSEAHGLDPSNKTGAIPGVPIPGQFFAG